MFWQVSGLFGEYALRKAARMASHDQVLARMTINSASIVLVCVAQTVGLHPFGVAAARRPSVCKWVWKTTMHNMCGCCEGDLVKVCGPQNLKAAGFVVHAAADVS